MRSYRHETLTRHQYQAIIRYLVHVAEIMWCSLPKCTREKHASIHRAPHVCLSSFEVALPERCPSPSRTRPGCPIRLSLFLVNHRRWEALLDLFHARWRGFGAALLVRLVETLLDKAALSSTPSRPKEDVAHPNCVGDGGSISKSGGVGGGEGLERRAAFIGVWVRHLLSRRWHLRAGDVSESPI